LCLTHRKHAPRHPGPRASHPCSPSFCAAAGFTMAARSGCQSLAPLAGPSILLFCIDPSPHGEGPTAPQGCSPRAIESMWRDDRPCAFSRQESMVAHLVVVVGGGRPQPGPQSRDPKRTSSHLIAAGTPGPTERGGAFTETRCPRPKSVLVPKIATCLPK